jgi:hypothetical protein
LGAPLWKAFRICLLFLAIFETVHL